MNDVCPGSHVNLHKLHTNLQTPKMPNAKWTEVVQTVILPGGVTVFHVCKMAHLGYFLKMKA